MMIGRRIKKLREEEHLTQQALGKMLNVTKTSICSYEKGKRTPTLDTLTRLCNLFSKDINYFLGLDKYAVADNDNEYGLDVSKEELEFIETIRKYPLLHDKLLDEPKRFVELISKKIS